MKPNEILYWNIHKIEKTKRKIENYENDEKKEERIKEQLCKHCFYIDNSRIAGQAFTHSFCKECKKEMCFPTTDTDKYCEKCATKLNACKHCGSEID